MSDKNNWDWSRDHFFTNDDVFRSIFTSDGTSIDQLFCLPRRHKDGFQSELHDLFRSYYKKVDSKIDIEKLNPAYGLFEAKDIDDLCKGILATIDILHEGFPSKAYDRFEKTMDDLTARVPLPSLRPNALNGHFETVSENIDPAMASRFYRVRCITDGNRHERSDIFHTPASMRDVISTSRYSIAGYPSLYLGDSLELCTQELDSPRDSIASCFSFRTEDDSQKQPGARIIDLGVRPQDFSFARSRETAKGRPLPTDYTSRYVFWFPLLASCSFIRAQRNGFYSDEYAIPQLLMQWLRLNKKPPYLMKYSNRPAPLPDDFKRRLGKIGETLDKSKPKNNLGISKSLLESIIGIADDLLSLSNELVSCALGDPGFMPSDDLYEIIRRILNTLGLLINSLQNPKEHLPPEGEGLPPNESQINDLKRTLQRTSRLLRWMETYRIVGIRYFSCKNLYAPGLGRNYVFPTERVTLDHNGKSVPDKDKADFCSQLNALFVWTEPQHRVDYKDISSWQDGLDKALLHSHGNLNGTVR